MTSGQKTSEDPFSKMSRTIKPSPQRVRNMLTLEERVHAIHVYNYYPMYTKVAKLFNCSWEQIKNIISNKESILKFYAATRKTNKCTDPKYEEMRKGKIMFLGECIYEYLQRAQYHRHAEVNEEIIRTKAIEFRDLIEIYEFVPNKSWLNHFKATYNISLANRQIVLTHKPPESLDLKDIMTYCGKQNYCVQTTTASTDEQEHEDDGNNQAKDERHKRKIDYMERALIEYIQRKTYHHKMIVTDEIVYNAAIELRDILKIQNFQPGKPWIAAFKLRFNEFLNTLAKSGGRIPPLSLDFHDILSYCSRTGQVQPPATVTLTPKKPQPQQQQQKNMPCVSEMQESTKEKQLITAFDNKNANNDSDDDDVIVVVEKPTVIEILDDEANPDKDECGPPPLKMQKLETLNGNEDKAANQGEVNAAELPSTVTNYEDALKLLKPLEEFAMLQDDFRVIGLLTQLEYIFRNSKEKAMHNFE